MTAIAHTAPPAPARGLAVTLDPDAVAAEVTAEIMRIVGAAIERLNHYPASYPNRPLFTTSD